MSLTGSSSSTPRKTLLIRTALGASLVFALACGGNSAPATDGGAIPLDGGAAMDGGGTDGGSNDGGLVEAGCRARWQILCQAWSTCETSAPYFPTLFADVPDCVAKGTALCLRFSGNVATLPGLGTTPAGLAAAASACTTAIGRRSACEIVTTYLNGANYQMDADCVPTQGTLVEGSSCVLSDQCQSRYCQYRGGCGVCANLADVDEPCEANQDCGPALACVGGICAAYVEADGACSATAPCRPDLGCVEGLCKAPLGEGATCNPRAVNPCKMGYCNQGQCQSFRTDGVAGGPCGVDTATGVVTACARGSTCRMFTASYQGVCVKRAAPGERCFFDTGFQGSQCEILSECINGVCARLPEPTCSSSGQPHPARIDGGILPPNDGGAELETEVQRQLGLACDALWGCDRILPVATRWSGARSRCETTLRPLIDNIVRAPRSGATLTNLRACDDALAAMSLCDRADRLFGAKRQVAACEAFGPLTAGSVCATNSQCASGTQCKTGTLVGPTCGVCATQQHDGGVCIDNNDCATGFACAQGRCLPGGGSGATCSSTAPCDFDLACVSGVCGAPSAVGGACNPRAPTCAAGLYCSPTRNQCEATLIAGASANGDGGVADGGAGDGGAGLADGGLACGLLGGSLVFCPYGQACKITNARTNTGVCDSAGGIGDPCAWSGGLDGAGACRFPAFCLDGVCTVGDATYCQ